MAEKINIGAKEPLYKAAEKLNGAIDEVNNFQTQIDQLVIEGDSSVEAAQARVDAEGNAYGTLKERLDTEHTNVTAQLAQTEKDIDKISSLNTTNYYVSTTGSDSNGGLSSTDAFATLQKAFDVIESSYVLINSTIQINIEEGTYNQGATLAPHVTTRERLKIVGNVDVNGLPTTIFDGTELSKHGIFTQDHSFIMVQDIHFMNYRQASRIGCGIQVQQSSNLYTKNVHVTNCDWGISVTGNTRIYVQGGIINDCSYGVKMYSNCLATIGYGAGGFGLGTLIKNCETGIHFQNQCSGHADYVVLDGNNYGIMCVNMSRVHSLECDIKNSTVAGVKIYTGSTWYNNNNTFTNNLKDYETLSFGTELTTHQDSRALLQTKINTAQLVHTGTTSLTLLRNGVTLPAKSFISEGRKLKVVAIGTFSGLGIKTLQIRSAASGNIISFNSVDGASNSWKLEFEMYAVNANTQKNNGTFIEGGASGSTVKGAYLLKNYDFTIDQTINLYGILSDTAGSITVETFEIQEVI